MKKKVLITAFEPFPAGKAKYNPTIDVVTAIKRSYCPQKTTVKTAVLEVAFDGAAKKVQEIAREYNPDFVFNIGLAAGRDKMYLETRGQNIMFTKGSDRNGFSPKDETIDPKLSIEHHLYVMDFGFFVVPMIDELKNQRHEIEQSDSAGKYVYNDIIYRTLQYLGKDDFNHNDFIYAFMHMPWLEKYRGKDIGTKIDWDAKKTVLLEEVVNAARLIIDSI